MTVVTLMIIWRRCLWGWETCDHYGDKREAVGRSHTSLHTNQPPTVSYPSHQKFSRSEIFLFPSHREASKSWIWFSYFKIFQIEPITSNNNFLRKERLGSSLLWLFQPRSTLVISSKWSLEWIRPRNPSESLGRRGREEQSRLSCARFPRTCTGTCTRLRQTQTHKHTQTQTQTHRQRHRPKQVQTLKHRFPRICLRTCTHLRQRQRNTHLHTHIDTNTHRQGRTHTDPSK